MTPSQLAGSVTLDPCRVPPTFSLERFFVFTLVYLIMMVSGVALVYLGDDPFRIQIAAVICYTSAIVLYTFSANRMNQPRYLFRCPIVQNQLPRIALRHLMFVTVLFALLTTALQLRQHMPPPWLVDSGDRRSLPPLTTVLFILSACLACAQILTHRSLLNRAHIQHSSPERDHVNPL